MEKLPVFNLNYTVWVQFTDVGFARLLSYRNRYGIPEGLVTLEELKAKCDSEGYYPMQGHELISAMSGLIHHNPHLFNMNIKLSPKGLQ